MVIIDDDVSSISDLHTYLHQHFDMKSLGKLRYFLCLEIYDTIDGIYLFQTKYAYDLISRVGLTDSKIASTPLEADCRLTPLDGTTIKDPTFYRQLVGSLIYLTITRPNIAYVVHIISQLMTSPHTTNHSDVLRTLRYIKGTLLHGLHFSVDSSLIPIGYSDADWAGDPTDRRSITSYCFFLGDSLVSR
ncbi:uncharacterized mitochondrial protein AtMg00810-like [Impatiens glandulifera]|uniref:uncharacterized mitochondrial protein AtMg00810-like n=1 Tax=Impatiens glandulifera TaxID=253017 RepID=UPI001FB0F6BC|nr:uncharacterized mitochondrial protein AtMg00810-like [Impatiens glandulifera]